MFPASLIALNVFCGMIGMMWGNRFVACLNFTVAAFIFSAEMIK